MQDNKSRFEAKVFLAFRLTICYSIARVDKDRRMDTEARTQALQGITIFILGGILK